MARMRQQQVLADVECCDTQTQTKIVKRRRAPKRGPSISARQCALVDAVVVPVPPIGATGQLGTPQQRRAIIAIGISIGAINPDPGAVTKHPMTIEVFSIVIVIAIGEMPIVAVPVASVEVRT